MNKILIVCHDNLLYGASRSMLDWVSNVEISKDKYNYIFLLPCTKGNLKDKLEVLGFHTITARYYQPIKKYNSKGIKIYIKNLIRKFLCYIFNPLAVMKIKSLCKKENIKLIHSNSYVVTVGARAAYDLKIPHVWHIREFMEEDHMMSFIYNDEYIRTLSNYSHPIFISKAIEDKFKGLFKLYSNAIIYNTIFYNNNYSKTRKFMEDGICNVIIVGKITKNKGQFEAVRTIAELLKDGNRIKLYICGEGPDEEAIKKYIISNKLENDINILGFRDDVCDIRKNMDIALMCSSNEAFGRVTVEAMYYENLVIGKRSAGTLEIINDHMNGLLYERDCLKDAILFAIQNTSASCEMIKQAKFEAVSRYSNSILTRIEDLYSDILGESY